MASDHTEAAPETHESITEHQLETIEAMNGIETIADMFATRALPAPTDDPKKSVDIRETAADE